MAPNKTMPKSPAKAGRKKNGSLETLDAQLISEASTDRTAEPLSPQAASSSKRPAAATLTVGEGPEKRRKEAKNLDSSEGEFSSVDDSDSDRSTDESSSSSSDSNEERVKRRSKAKGFITMRNNPLITVGNRGTLRKTARLLKSQASLMDRIDRVGKEVFVENYKDVREKHRQRPDGPDSRKRGYPSVRTR